MDSFKKNFIVEQAKIFKALGHPSRLLMVDAIKSGEKCVCDLKRLVGGDMSTISRHLSVLKEAGIVVSEKRGNNIFYSLAIGCLGGFLNCTAQLIEERVSGQLEILKRK